MKKIITLIFFLFIAQCFVYADALPHFTNNVTVRICGENGTTDFLELRDDRVTFDTINNRNTTEDYWLKTTIRGLGNNKWILRSHSDFRPFKLSVLYNGQVYQSDLITIYGNNDLYRFCIKDGRLINVSPLFYRPWQEYFTSLGLTLLIELGIGIFLLRKKQIPLIKSLIILFLINIISHPILTFVYSHVAINLLILEVGVTLLEAGLLKIFLNRKNINIKWALKTSVILNVASFILGYIVLFILKH